MRASPAEDGFAAQPDWAPTGRVWLAWPSRADDWPAGLSDAQDEVAALARAAAEFAPVTVIAPADHAPTVSIRCGPGVAVFPCPVDEPWAHDFGPTFVKDAEGDVAGVDWRYKAWGGARRAQTDRMIAPMMLDNLGMARFGAEFPMEGGLAQVDGEGTALVSRIGLSNPGRSAKFDVAKAEEMLKRSLGVEAVIWLDTAVEGDDAKGRIDAMAAFVAPGKIALTKPKLENDALCVAYQEMAAALSNVSDAKGRAIEILALPAAKRRLRPSGGRAPLSYAGFLLAGDGLIVPAFDDPADDVAADILAAAFPKRRVTESPAMALAMGGATLRAAACLQPAGPPAP